MRRISIKCRPPTCRRTNGEGALHCDEEDGKCEEFL